MTLDDFRKSLTEAEPPAELTLALSGLWWDAKGDWTQAHESAQQDEGPEGSWVHAYCIARKAIRATQPTGMAGQASPFAENRSMRNGSALRKTCWDRSTPAFCECEVIHGGEKERASHEHQLARNNHDCGGDNRRGSRASRGRCLAHKDHDHRQTGSGR
jgi:hypothetical protein